MAQARRKISFSALILFLCIWGLCLSSCAALNKNKPEAAPVAENQSVDHGEGTPGQTEKAAEARSPESKDDTAEPGARMTHATDPDATPTIRAKKKPAKAGQYAAEPVAAELVAPEPVAADQATADQLNAPDNSAVIADEAPPAQNATEQKKADLQEVRAEEKPTEPPLAAAPATQEPENKPQDSISPQQAQLMEPEQRSAFITLLKTRLNKKKSLYVPPLEEKEIQAVGPYAAQYELLRSLAEEKTLFKGFTPAGELETRLANDPENKENYGMLLAESRQVRQLQTELANFYRKSVSEREALQQPFSLKSVYDEAFSKKILEPVAGLLKISPYIEEQLRIVAYAYLATSAVPQRPGAAEVFKEQLARYKDISDEGNDLIRKIRGEE